MFVENINEIDINTILLDAMKTFLVYAMNFRLMAITKPFSCHKLKNWGSVVEHLCHVSKIKGSSPAMADQEKI